MSARDADTYESQNNQQLDALHSKIRSLRGVTTDIYDDVERQNLTLDDTGNSFTGLAGSLAQSSRRAAHAFSSSGSLKQCRFLVWIVGATVGLWIAWHVLGWFWPKGGTGV